MKIGLIGKNIGYSQSKNIFENEYGCEYNVFDIEEHQLKDAINFMFKNGYTGFNITKPYKQIFVKFFEKNFTKYAIYKLSSMNCVKFFKDGTMVGKSFDGQALFESLDIPNIQKFKNVAYIGNGGVIPALIPFFGGKYNYSRHPDPKDLKFLLNLPLEKFHLGWHDLIINTIPFEANLQLDLKQETLRKFIYVDLNYSDDRLVNEAKENPMCIKSINGLGMLKNNAKLTYEWLSCNKPNEFREMKTNIKEI